MRVAEHLVGQKDKLQLLFLPLFLFTVCNIVSCHCCRNTTHSELLNVVAELIHFVGWISTLALRLENNPTFLLYFILDFYETVCILLILAFKIPIL